MDDITAAAAAAGGDDHGTAKGATTTLVLPTHPGLDALAHVATQWVEFAERRLAEKQLKGVAYGRPPPAALAIKDFPLDRLPKTK